MCPRRLKLAQNMSYLLMWAHREPLCEPHTYLYLLGYLPEACDAHTAERAHTYTRTCKCAYVHVCTA